MRILLRRRSEERGATAILVALLAIILIGIASFTLDFGQAYVAKRQLQTAADAAVLAAGAVYAPLHGTCAHLTDTSDADYATHLQGAKDAADDVLKANAPDASGSMDTPTCNAKGQLVVSVTVSTSTPVTLGAVYGAKAIHEQRKAEATVQPVPAALHLRPYAICSADTPDPSDSFPTGVLKIGEPGQAHTSAECPGADSGGNWWFIDCPEDTNGSIPTIVDNVKNGCDDPIGVVKNQPTSASPSELSNYLLGQCPLRSETCIGGDTGNSSLKNTTVTYEWDKLLGKQIVIPVFCGEPTCQPAAVTGTGKTAIYPVQRLAAVVVCGFHFYDVDDKVSNTGKCSDNTFTDASGDNNEVYLLLKFVTVLDSGDTQTDGYALGGDQDGGLHSVLLSQ